MPYNPAEPGAPAPLNCILVQGRKYCEAGWEPAAEYWGPGRSLGAGLLAFVVVVVYVWFLVYQAIYRQRLLAAGLGFLAPLVIVGLFLVLR